MQIVSRTGTGSGSSSSPCSITFNFAVRFVFPLGGSSDTDAGALHTDSPSYNPSFLYVSSLSTSYPSSYITVWGTGSSAFAIYAKRSSDSKTIYWYGGSGDYTSSINGKLYFFLGIA